MPNRGKSLDSPGVVAVGVVGVVPLWLNKAKQHHININLKTMLHHDKIKKEKNTIHKKKLNKPKKKKKLFHTTTSLSH